MRCAICDKEDWHVRKDLNSVSQVGICKECGYVCHMKDEAEEEKLLNFYRTDYRNIPNNRNIITTTNKLNYIKAFITDYLKDAQKNKKKLICGDVGAATGYLPAWLRRIGHQATGSEYTTTFRRFSEHFYGVPLTEKLEPKHKYDFICFYHTLEHMVAPDKKLLEHKALLKDDGVIMISVPEWFSVLEDLSGAGLLTVRNYFHEYHINCFTRQSFLNLLAKCGLKIVKIDDLVYGMTVLVGKSDKHYDRKNEDWQVIDKQINQVKVAIELNAEQKFRPALEAWNKFPGAYSRLIFDHYRKDMDRQEATFEEAFKLMPGDLGLRLARGILYYQHAQYELALKEIEAVADVKPDIDCLMHIAWCYEHLGRYKEALAMMGKIQEMNPPRWRECTDWMCSICAKIPAWDERAREEVKAELLKKAQPNIQLTDKGMEADDADNKSPNK